MNSSFGIEASREEWKTVIKPITEKTMWDICLFIAERAEKELQSSQDNSDQNFVTKQTTFQLTGTRVL